MTERTGCERVDRLEPGALTQIRQRLAEAATGDGRVVYIEGPPEGGKTQLATAAAEAARAAGMNVLPARGRPLERKFPFGVVIQLFEETWFAAGARERTMLLEGPARPAGELLSGMSPDGPEVADERAYPIIHGLFWLTRALAPDGASAVPAPPLALIVDDVDCADGPSLRFLAYLASRIGQLPIVVVVAARPDPPSADPAALSTVRSSSELLVLTPVGSSPGAPTEGPRAAAAHLALRKSLTEGHRESVVDLAELAWGEGALLESDGDTDAWPALAGSLLFVDELERAVEVAEAATASGRVVGPPGAARWQGWSLYHQGRITAALAVAEAARAVHRGDLVARGLIAACRLAQGRLDEAGAALLMVSDGGGDGIEEFDAPMLLDLRAQLRLEQLRPADALADALEAGRLSRGPSGVLGAGVVAWRSTAALARLALGERGRARNLAEEELEVARERGLTRVVIRDLRILAFAATGTRVLDLLGEAVRVGRAAHPRLEYMNALVDLGAATRRANQRTAARHPLRKGLELAEREGAAALARRAREELDATGARSRRVLLSGIQALTPSERRVADLAARGLTTREIAQALFVTPKTVEFHLRHVYRKLDIPSSRADLSRALSSAASG
ncbi:MAG TPA: LuxR C-terminal-related transcriptional regulator [Solirubrobacteraceae bacterium]|nr:LuxR C-terminal-related transcriptional regulator [Solirubrobacteraceae bacterium]